MKGIYNLKDADVKGKRVLVRCDFNVPLDKKGRITDDFRIKKTLPTIGHLLLRDVKIILMTHLGDPRGKSIPYLKTDNVSKKLQELLNRPVKKIDYCVGSNAEKEISSMKRGDIILLENLRFHKEEQENNANFSRSLAKLADIYVNDAFSACHRHHASIVGVPEYLPSLAGLLLEKEINVLSRALETPTRPLVVVIGGVKISTKLTMVKRLLQQADHVLLGSKLAEIILAANNILIGRDIKEDNIFKEIREIKMTNPKLHMPTDGVMSLSSLNEKYRRVGAIGTIRKDEDIFDIGPETIKFYRKIIKTAKTIIWNGPVGYFEMQAFYDGTKKIAEAICENYSAFKIAGGGDTDAFLHAFDLREKFDHVSTGGGAMLNFLSGENLPGVEALKNAKGKKN